MNFIFNILKGAVIGVANIIPGVSGGTMMVTMGIYDKLLHAITHLFKEFKKSVITLLPIVIGMGVGIVGLAKIIELMFEKVPVQTNLLFIGLIIGGLPMMAKKVKGSGFKISYVLGFVAFFALVVVLALFDGTVGAAADMSFSFVNCIVLILVGIIAAATMVIPGVSGSMMLMLLGFYEPIIGTINGLVESLTAGDINGMVSGALVLIPFGIGVVVGIFIVAGLIEFLLKKCPFMVFWCIIGLIVASPFAIIYLNLDAFMTINVVSIITGIIAFVVGCVIAYFLGGEGNDENGAGERKEEK